MEEIKKIFADDFIKIGKRKIKPFTFLWWVIRLIESICIVGYFYFIYVGLWVFFG